ncbi:MAG: alpha-amylase [Geobacteraceae bacterium]|nr:alpha-amylase [Geobacteraceae bacterium]
MTADVNGVMLQGFHWFLKSQFPDGRNLWKFFSDEADNLRAAGFDAVWIPPAYKPAGNRESSVGYDVYDHFDLGEFDAEGRVRTKYGTKAELLDAIAALHGRSGRKRISVYADVVLNHKMGGAPDGWWQAVRVDKEHRNIERRDPGYESGEIEIKGWTKFEHAERANAYSSFKWESKHFDSVDAVEKIRQNGCEFNDPQDKYIYRYLHNEPNFLPADKEFEHWVSLEKGNYDYLTGADLDYGRYDVREEMKYWGAWFAVELGLDGFRLDAVKHFTADFLREWLGHVRAQRGADLFAVGEYIAGDTGPLHDYIARVSAYGEYPQRITLFDFPLRFKLGEASRKGDSYDLRWLSSGTLVSEQPPLAVTFVENHDYEYGRDYESHVQEWFKPLAYAFILLRQGGYPCIFFPDYFGSGDRSWRPWQMEGKEYLDLLLKLRKQFALGDERYYAERNIAGWVRMGFVPGAKGAMAVVINNSPGGVQGIRMDTGRSGKCFYHLATIKSTPGGFVVARGDYQLYGTKSGGLWTDSVGCADFVAEGGTVSVWLEHGVGLS